MADQAIEFSDRSRYVRALYAYESKDDTQLTVHPGDILEVFYRDDSGWWDGRNVSTQHDGYFPGAYTEPLGDNLDAIKQQLLYEDDDDDDSDFSNRNNHYKHSHSVSLLNEDTSVTLRNAEPLSRRCKKSIKNDCNLCTIHCRALCLYLPICSSYCRIRFYNNNNSLSYFEYDAYVFRSLSTIQHTLCIFGAISFNHFLSSLIDDLNDNISISFISSSNNFSNSSTNVIRGILALIFSIFYIFFLFITSQTALNFLKESFNIRNRYNRDSIRIRNNHSTYCGIKSCKPYTFLYTQFIMLLFSYILGFLWMDFFVVLQYKKFQNNNGNWYKNVIYILLPLLLLSLIILYLLKLKLNKVYHIYKYYSKQANDLYINQLNQIDSDPAKQLNQYNNINISPATASASINNNNYNRPYRPYQVSLYLYFWCLLTEITLFMLALPFGACCGSYIYWILCKLITLNHTITRILTMILYIILFIFIYVLSWRMVHLSIYYKNKSKKNNKNQLQTINSGISSNRSSVTSPPQIQQIQQIQQINTINLLSSTDTNATMSTNYSVNTNKINYADDDIVDNDGLSDDDIIRLENEYETDIPDDIIIILMKYYGREIESTQFRMLSIILLFILFCDIFIIGIWYNMWLIFDDDKDPFNPSTKYINISSQYLLYTILLTIFLPFIVSYFFGKTFKYYCCRRNNYRLSISLEKDKLWMKSLLSRWFIEIQSLILGYLWCEYFQLIWIKHIDERYRTVTNALWCLLIYIIILFVIIIFKLNKKLLKLLWTMHDEEDDNELFCDKKTKIKKKSYKKSKTIHSSKFGVGNLGLNASVKNIEKKFARRMISQKTKSANKALIVIKTDNNNNNNNNNNNDNNDDNDSINDDIENIIDDDDDNNAKRSNSHLKMTDLSTALLDDNEDIPQIM